MLVLRDFSFSFADHQALADLSFSLPAGAYLSILGPNGAGKSTLLKCLLRLHEQGKSAGEILLEGRKLSAYSQRELARIIAYVPQAGGFIPPFTVLELLNLSRYPHLRAGQTMQSRDKAATERALELTRMRDFASRPLRTLSGGERQKAYLASALAQESKILLLDEPAAFLDPRHAAELNKLLFDLHEKENLTMLCVTHDLNHPLYMGGSALILSRGRQLYFGRARNLAQQELLEQAFEHSFSLVQNPKTGRPAILAD